MDTQFPQLSTFCFWQNVFLDYDSIYLPKQQQKAITYEKAKYVNFGVSAVRRQWRDVWWWGSHLTSLRLSPERWRHRFLRRGPRVRRGESSEALQPQVELCWVAQGKMQVDNDGLGYCQWPFIFYGRVFGKVSFDECLKKEERKRKRK